MNIIFVFPRKEQYKGTSDATHRLGAVMNFYNNNISASIAPFYGHENQMKKWQRRKNALSREMMQWAGVAFNIYYEKCVMLAIVKW